MSTLKSSAENLTLNADGSGNDVIIQSNASTKVTVDGSAGDVKVESGDLFFATADKGIVLGATSNTDANTLDDYEEGTWTPTVKGSSSDGSYTYDETRRWGKYSKVGNIVFVSFCFRINGGSAGSGSTQIWGLPYTPNVTVQGAYPRSPGICLAQSATAFTGTIICTIEGASAYLGLQEQNTTTNVDIPVTDADLTNSIYSGSMVYWVS